MNHQLHVLTWQKATSVSTIRISTILLPITLQWMFFYSVKKKKKVDKWLEVIFDLICIYLLPILKHLFLNMPHSNLDSHCQIIICNHDQVHWFWNQWCMICFEANSNPPGTNYFMGSSFELGEQNDKNEITHF